MSSLLAIDPGSAESAYVVLTDGAPSSWGTEENESLIRRLRGQREFPVYDHLAIEMIVSYGMSVGQEVFDTCVTIGRIIEAYGGPFTKVFRRDEKSFLCGDMKATDSNIRTALIDLYGGKQVGIGNKKSPGPLWGIKGDEWAALAVGITWTRSPKFARERGEQ